MIASLRGRLVAGVLVLAAVGMLLVGAVTYASQRSFLLDRVDAQLSGATFALEHQLDGDKQPYGGPRRGGPPPGGGAPSDTFGELRDRSGSVIKTRLPRPETRPARRLTCRTTSSSVSPRRSRRRSATTACWPSPPPTERSSSPRSRCRATNQTLERLLLVEGIVIVVVLGLVGGFALVVVRVGLLPLDRMGHTAAAIAGGDLSHRVETTDQRTEVGRLGLALNRMLDRLEDAFAAREASQERLRRFIADASHELRTPLVSIRGYAELFRMGAAR